MPAFIHTLELDNGTVRLLVRYEINPGSPGDRITPREYAFAENIRCYLESGPDAEECGKHKSRELGELYYQKCTKQIDAAVNEHLEARESLPDFS